MEYSDVRSSSNFVSTVCVWPHFNVKVPTSTPLKQLLWWTWTPNACQEESPLTSCNKVKQLQLSLQREKTKFGVSFSVQFISKRREQHRVWCHASGRSSRANHGRSVCAASCRLMNRYDEHFTRRVVWFIVCFFFCFFFFLPGLVPSGWLGIKMQLETLFYWPDFMSDLNSRGPNLLHTAASFIYVSVHNQAVCGMPCLAHTHTREMFE